MNVLTYDLRGHGNSKKHKYHSDFFLGGFAEDLYELLIFLKIIKPVLISHSFGTLIALEFLERYQDLCGAAVFLSPNFSMNRRRSARMVRPLIKAGVKATSILPFMGKMKGRLDYSKYLDTGDWNLRRMIADVRITGLKTYFYSLDNAYDFDKEEFLGRIGIPVLLIHGEKDTIFPVEYSRVMSEKIRGSKLVLLEHADHIVVLNNFPEVSAAIDEFVKSL
jgi:3-oxoadipate enol-lactonase